MVLEQIIPELFPQACQYCTAIVDSNEPVQPTFAPFTSGLPDQPNGATKRRSSSDEDDNYDDDDEPNTPVNGAGASGPNGPIAANGAEGHTAATVMSDGTGE